METQFRGAFAEAAIGMALSAVGPSPPAGTFLAVNRAFCELTGRAPDELLGLTFNQISHPEDAAIGLQVFQAVASGREARGVIEKRYLRPDGSQVWTRVTVSAVTGADGSPLHLVAQAEDVTARKVAEAKLLVRTRDLEAMSHRLRRLIDRLVRVADAERRQIAMAIHDDPVQHLAAATLMVERLRRHTDESPGDLLERIEGALRSATGSLRHLLFELTPPELVESGLAAAINSTAAQLFAESDVRVNVEIDLRDEPPDAIQTTAFRVVAEALTNVRKHAAARTVDVFGRVGDGILVIEVVDDGVGIRSSADIGHLGMRSMRDRAEAVGGSLAVRSGAGGTTVLARLPLAHDAPTEPSGIGSEHDDDDEDDDEDDVIAEALGSGRDFVRIGNEDAPPLAGPGCDWLAVMEALGDRMRSALPDRTACAEVAVRLLATAVHDGVAIHVLTDDGDVCAPVARWHRDPVQLAHLAEGPLGERSGRASFCATVIGTAEPILLDRSSFQGSPASDSVLREPHSAVLVPIRRAATPIAVLTILRDLDPDVFTSDDVRRITAIADVIAGVLPP